LISPVDYHEEMIILKKQLQQLQQRNKELESELQKYTRDFPCDPDHYLSYAKEAKNIVKMSQPRTFGTFTTVSYDLGEIIKHVVCFVRATLFRLKDTTIDKDKFIEDLSALPKEGLVNIANYMLTLQTAGLIKFSIFSLTESPVISISFPLLKIIEFIQQVILESTSSK